VTSSENKNSQKREESRMWEKEGGGGKKLGIDAVNPLSRGRNVARGGWGGGWGGGGGKGNWGARLPCGIKINLKSVTKPFAEKVWWGVD